MRRFIDKNLELIYYKPGDWYIQPNNPPGGLRYPQRNTASYRRLEMVTVLLILGVV